MQVNTQNQKTFLIETLEALLNGKAHIGKDHYSVTIPVRSLRDLVGIIKSEVGVKQLNNEDDY